MFRTHYLDYAELGAQLTAWASAHPEFVTLSVLGKSAQGRDIPLLTIGRNPQQHRPAVWIDGNMHATEVCGTSVALAIAQDVIAIHLGKDEAGGKPLPAHMAQAIRNTLFYVVPRMSPDGAEAILKTGRYVRSSPVNDRVDRSHAFWEASDVDGDGLMGYMRQQDPLGELVELRGEDGVALSPPVATEPSVNAFPLTMLAAPVAVRSTGRPKTLLASASVMPPPKDSNSAWSNRLIGSARPETTIGAPLS